MAIAALQASEEFLKESKRVSEAFHAATPTSRAQLHLEGTAKYMFDKIPKDASSKVRMNQDLYTQEKVIGTPPPLPDFALALTPEDCDLPPLDPLWNKEDRHRTKSGRLQFCSFRHHCHACNFFHASTLDVMVSLLIT